MRKRLANLFDRDFWRVVLPLALPIALQNLLMNSFRLVDTLMIGQLGDTAIASVGLAGQVSFFVEIVSFGLASGSAVFIAQYHGANDLDGIHRTFGATLLFAVPVGLIAALAALLYPEFLMGLFTNDARLIAEGARYLSSAAVSYVGLAVYPVLAVTLRSTERVRLPMLTSIVSAVANAILNYVLIFGKLGLPALGVAGAGLATTVSALLNAGLLVLLSVRERNILIAPLKKLLHFSGFLGLYWSRVLPVLINEAIWSLSILGVNMVFGRMGADNYAALTVFRTVENIIFVCFVGVCNACNILVGKRIGAGDIEEGKEYARRFVFLVPLLGLAVGLLILLMRAPVISLFDISPEAAHTARTLLLIYAFEVGVRNIPYILVVGVFRAGGDTHTGLIGDGVVQYGLVLPTVILCGLVWKLPFLTTYLLMLLVDDATKCTYMLLRFRSMKWIQPVTREGQRVRAVK